MHALCTHDRPQTIGIVERAARRVKEGPSCALVQLGFNVEIVGRSDATRWFLVEHGNR